MKTSLTISIVAVLLGLTTTAYVFNAELQKQKKENAELLKTNAKLSQAVLDFSKSFQDIAKLKTYSISLAPNVTNHVSPVFGSAKNLTLQYYFTMDGNAIQVKADSVYEKRRIQ